MKTKHGLFFGFAGLLVAAIFSLTGCLMEDDGGGGSYGPTDDTYDYPLKFLYEHHFSYTRNSNAIFPGNPYPTLAEVIKFLAGEDSLWETEVDIYAYVNSKWGEQTAKLWQPYIQYWEKPMDTGLVTYWNNRGLTKIKLDGGTAQNISTDSYIYYPRGADQDTSDKKYPLVLLFHGGGEPAYQVETFGFCQIAAEEGLFLAAGETNSAANMHNLMNYMLDTYPMIDQERVYAVGSSQGGGAANNFSLTYIQEVAAVGVMEQPISLNTLGNTVNETQVANIKQYGRPVVCLGGFADMYGMFRIRSKDGETVPSAYFLAHEGSAGIEGGQPYAGGSPAPTGSRTYPDYVTGWNKMLEAYGASSDYYFAAPPSTTRLENARAATQDSITYWTGYKFDKTEVDTQYGCKVYKNTFNGVDDFLAVIVENRGHMPSGYDASYIWNFLSQWKRNTNTKQSEKL